MTVMEIQVCSKVTKIHNTCFAGHQDRAYEIVEDMESNKVRKMKKRICLVLDCLCAHDFSDKTADLINLQHYVIKEKRLSEREAIVIFYDVVRVVEALHKVGIKVPLFHHGRWFLAHKSSLFDHWFNKKGQVQYYCLSICRKTLCTEIWSWETWC